ncbi:Mediator of RNA polymerase II transcription subunit 8 [Pleurostoma richardsiae]|uniref:Mediator of RNA polymerase II transcription subunit 8 n=1 Tax=Pleurostoma richardsiae TaxID=41990 RepID=A0AA38RND6_9PEZI|nr:Mediator of RNA polymerase II transcription subunit 8 [Pleurostoma richardsiae]
MASLNLTADELKALDSTRNRLFQLANSIGSLKNDIYQSNPLPNPASLRNSAYILQQNLSSLLAVTAEHASLFQRVVVHPSTNYPGRAQEGVLMQLLRKKLEPDVESLVEKGREAALAAGLDPQASFVSLEALRAERDRARVRYDDEDDEDEDDEDDDEDAEGVPQEPLGLGDVWADARDWYMDRMTNFIRVESSDMYTAAERAMGVENVRTGLRRPLEEEDEDEDEDESDEEGEDVVMQGVAPVAPSSAAPVAGQPGVAAAAAGPGEEPERMLWFAARGDAEMPAYIETERQRLEREGKLKQRI